jgi:hypothetical protein
VRFEDILESHERQEDESSHKAPDPGMDEILDELPDNPPTQHSKSETGKLHNLMALAVACVLYIQEDRDYYPLLSCQILQGLFAVLACKF